MHERIKQIERKVKRDNVLVIVPTAQVLPTKWAMDCSMHGVPIGTRQQYLFVSSPSRGDAVNYGLYNANDLAQDFALVLPTGHTTNVWGGWQGHGILNMLQTFHSFPQIDLLSPVKPPNFHDHILKVEQGETGFFMVRVSVLHRLDIFAEEYPAPVKGADITLRRYFVDDDFEGGPHFADLCRKAGVTWWQHGGVQCVDLDGTHYADRIPEESSEPSVLLAS